MALVSLYAPESVPSDFLNRAADLVRLVAPTEALALFDRTDSCACPTRDGLAVRDRSLIVKRHTHPASGYPVYALPEDCSLEESVVIVTWLVRYRFKTFRSRIQNGTLERSLESPGWFQKTPCGNCCDLFTLNTDPVFLLKPIVVSAYGKGPTLESVLKQSP